MTLARRVMMVLREAAAVLDPALWSWGMGSVGSLGDGSTTNRSSPVQVGTLSDWVILSSGGRNSSEGWNQAIKSNGTLWAWGAGPLGNLGLGDTNNRSSPVQVGSLTTWKSVSAGAAHSFGIQSNGTLWAWGLNSTGQLGQISNNTNRSSPVQIGSLTTWTAVAAGAAHGVALQSNGTLWTWGRNNEGELGQISNTTNRSSPVQVGSLTTWTAVAAAYTHCLALQSNGTLWTWGDNRNGRLADGSTTNRSSPVQVGSLTTWSGLGLGSSLYHSVALQSNGTLWTWGTGSSGRLGDGAASNRSSPVQVGSLTSWVMASGGVQMSAVRADGTIWTWGPNGTGALGDGSTIDRSSPVQVGSLTSWTNTSTSGTHTLGLR